MAAINEAGGELRERGFTLRADAFVFLHVNLRLLVVAPWLALWGPDADVGAIDRVIRLDLERVLRLATEEASEAGEREVSANAVSKPSRSYARNW